MLISVHSAATGDTSETNNPMVKLFYGQVLSAGINEGLQFSWLLALTVIVIIIIHYFYCLSLVSFLLNAKNSLLLVPRNVFFCCRQHMVSIKLSEMRLVLSMLHVKLEKQYFKSYNAICSINTQCQCHACVVLSSLTVSSET